MNTLTSRRINSPHPPRPFNSASKSRVLRPICAQIFPDSYIQVPSSENLRCHIEICNENGNGTSSIGFSGMPAAVKPATACVEEEQRFKRFLWASVKYTRISFEEFVDAPIAIVRT